MKTIVTITSIVRLLDGTPANGTITITPNSAFEYDEGLERRKIPVFPITREIKNGLLLTPLSLAPTSGANHDHANITYIAKWTFPIPGSSAKPKSFTEIWVIPQTAPATIELTSIENVQTGAGLPPILKGEKGDDGLPGTPGGFTFGEIDEGDAFTEYDGIAPIECGDAFTEYGPLAEQEAAGLNPAAVLSLSRIGSNMLYAGENLGGQRAVTIDGLLTVRYSDPLNLLNRHVAIGITRYAVVSGDAVDIQTEGIMTDPSWSWTPDQDIYVGPSGALTQTYPLSGYALPIATAISATSIFIDRREPVLIAP